MAKMIGRAISLGYVAVLVFQVCIFFHFVGLALHSYDWDKYNCTLPILASPLPVKRSPTAHSFVSPALTVDPTKRDPTSAAINSFAPPFSTSTSEATSPSASPLSPSPPLNSPACPYGGAVAPSTNLDTEGASSTTKPPISTLKPGRNCVEYDFAYLKLALCAQFVSGFGIALCAYLSWSSRAQTRRKLKHLASSATLSTIMGILSALAWREVKLAEDAGYQWHFWPFTFSYVYVLMAVIPMAVYSTGPEGWDSELRLTEAQWRRWQRVENRRALLDELLEATGGGDVIYRREGDGSYRISRWTSDDEGNGATPGAARGGASPDTAITTDGNESGSGQGVGVSAPSSGETDVLMVIPGDIPTPMVLGSADPKHCEPTAAAPANGNALSTELDKDEENTSTCVPLEEVVTSAPDSALVAQAGPTPSPVLAEEDADLIKLEENSSGETSPLLVVDGKSNFRNSYGGTS